MITLIKSISGLKLQHLHWDGIHGKHVPTVRFPRPSLLGWRRILTLACYLGTPSAKLGVTGKKSSLHHVRFSTQIQISSGQSYCWATFVVTGQAAAILRMWVLCREQRWPWRSSTVWLGFSSREISPLPSWKLFCPSGFDKALFCKRKRKNNKRWSIIILSRGSRQEQC